MIAQALQRMLFWLLTLRRPWCWIVGHRLAINRYCCERCGMDGRAVSQQRP